MFLFFFFSSRRRHTRCSRDWSSDVCSSDLVADDPDDPEGHKALGEALIEAGERERGIEELDLATTGFETRGNLRQAQDLVDEILRLDPNSVRHRQKQVEFAFKSGDKAKLIDARSEEHTSELQSRL